MHQLLLPSSAIHDVLEAKLATNDYRMIFSCQLVHLLEADSVNFVVDICVQEL